MLFAIQKHKKSCKFVTNSLIYNNFIGWSGYQDSNLGPPAPKAGALTGLRYTPKASLKELKLISSSSSQKRCKVTTIF